MDRRACPKGGARARHRRGNDDPKRADRRAIASAPIVSSPIVASEVPADTSTAAPGVALAVGGPTAASAAVSEAAPETAGAAARNPNASGPPAGRAFDFEKLVGVRLFAWLGGLGLFIGAAFFLEYSIEHDLISPPMRIGIGLVAGAVAVFLGDYIRGKADRAGQALGGAGIATLYASLFAGHTLYHLMPATATFAAMAFVSALAGVIAVRRDAFVLAVIGLVGGFATPVLLSTGEDHRYALFGYIGLLDAGILFVAAKRKWMALTALAFVATSIIYAGWASEYLDEGGVPFGLGVAAALSALFAVGTLNRSEAPALATRQRAGLFGLVLASPFIAALATAAQTGSARRRDAPFGLPMSSARGHVRHGQALRCAIFAGDRRARRPCSRSPVVLRRTCSEKRGHAHCSPSPARRCCFWRSGFGNGDEPTNEASFRCEGLRELHWGAASSSSRTPCRSRPFRSRSHPFCSTRPPTSAGIDRHRSRPFLTAVARHRPGALDRHAPRRVAALRGRAPQ